MSKEESSNSEPASSQEKGLIAPVDSAVGYGQPPVHRQFKPGQSGNPKGRPKGVRNLTSQRKELYQGLIQVRDGNGVRWISRAVAVEMALFQRALKGDHRAAQLITKYAKELGVYDDVSCESVRPLTRDQIATLSDLELDTMIAIEKRFAN